VKGNTIFCPVLASGGGSEGEGGRPRKAEKKVVLDTNIVVSGLLHPKGNPAQVL
jgi:hypothetical protein